MGGFQPPLYPGVQPYDYEAEARRLGQELAATQAAVATPIGPEYPARAAMEQAAVPQPSPPMPEPPAWTKDRPPATEWQEGYTQGPPTPWWYTEPQVEPETPEMTAQMQQAKQRASSQIHTLGQAEGQRVRGTGTYSARTPTGMQKRTYKPVAGGGGFSPSPDIADVGNPYYRQRLYSAQSAADEAAAQAMVARQNREYYGSTTPVERAKTQAEIEATRKGPPDYRDVLGQDFRAYLDAQMRQALASGDPAQVQAAIASALAQMMQILSSGGYFPLPVETPAEG